MAKTTSPKAAEFVPGESFPCGCMLLIIIGAAMGYGFFAVGYGIFLNVMLGVG